MSIVDFIEKILNCRKKLPSQPLEIINDPDGVVVARQLGCEDLRRSMYETDDLPGLCPYCHNTLEKIPNLDFRTRTKKDFVGTYDGFYIVSEKFKIFCDEQGFDNITFIPLKKSPGHYYFSPNTFFPVDYENTLFEHTGEPCPKCGNYRWFGGPHRIYSNQLFTDNDNFIYRTKEYYGDKGRKFFLIIIGLKTARLMKERGFDNDYDDILDEIHYIKDEEITRDGSLQSKAAEPSAP